MIDENWTETAAEQTKGLVKDHDDLVRASGRATKKLADEQSLLEREQRHRVALLEASRECLAGNEADMSYLKFKQDMRRTDENVIVAKDAIKVLHDEVLPSLQTQKARAVQQLSSALRNHCLAQKEMAEKAMIQSLYDSFLAYDSYLSEAQILYDSAGLGSNVRNRGMTPGRFLKVVDKIGPDFFRTIEWVKEERQKAAAAVESEAVEPSPEPEVSVPAEVPEQPLSPPVPEVSKTLLTGIIEVEQVAPIPAPEPLPESPVEPAANDEFEGPAASLGPIPPCMPAARTLSSTVAIGGEVEADR